MVKEHQYIFDVDDIKSLIYVCVQCGQEVVCKLEGEFRPGEHCENCRESLSATNMIQGIDPNYTLLINLRSVLKTSDTRVKIRFVVPDPDKHSP